MRGFLATFLILTATLATPGAHAWPRPDSPTGRLLQPVLDVWPALAQDDLARAAHLFGVTDYRAAAEVLKACAASDQAAAASCLLALAAQRDRSIAPSLRAHLRTSARPMVLAVAAATLGAWHDTFSHATLMQALLSGRGDARSQLALITALDALDRPWEQVYFRLALPFISDADVRLAMAARLVSTTPWDVRPAMASRLTRALEHATTHAPADAMGSYRAQLAVWGLTRGIPEECQAVLWSLNGASWATPATWRAVGPQCARIGGPRNGIEVAVQKAPRFPERPGSGLPVANETWLRDLGVRHSLWPSRPSAPAKLAWLLNDKARRRFGASVAWSPAAAAQLAGPTRLARPSAAAMERAAAGQTYPDDFDRFDPQLDQPTWWPRGLQLTIDDGPRPAAMHAILDVLDQHGVKVTFFLVGRTMARRWLEQPKQTGDLLRRVVDGGHAIGFHGMDHFTEPHLHMRAWRPEQIRDSVALFRRVLTLALGRQYPVVFGRLPGGTRSGSDRMRHAFHLSGLRAPLRWNAGAPDWERGTAPERLIELAARWSARAPQPVVVLLHEYVELADELDAFLTALR